MQSAVSSIFKCLSYSIPNEFTRHVKTYQANVQGYFMPCAHKSDCVKAHSDIPEKVDCDCEGRKKKAGLLYRMKLKILEGGTNFGTPFRKIECKELKTTDPECKKKAVEPCKPAPDPIEKKVYAEPPCERRPERPGVQVAILGADTRVGQYVALLLKQCGCVSKIRLYEAKEPCNPCCDRTIYNIADDLRNIDTDCRVQSFCRNDLDRCLQSADIVLILESGHFSYDMPIENRFCCQAPLVKHYTDVIANECPKAFIIVNASPIDCIVPIVAMTLKETGWYDPRKVLGSLAVPEMRASTLAAKALGLEPRYTRVPCVGGTEGEALVPLFSRAVDHFDFSEENTQMLTNAVRSAPVAVARKEGDCAKAADLSEAHALACLVKKVAYGLLCLEVPIITGFVETDNSHVISPAKYIANTVEITNRGIGKYHGLLKMSDFETYEMDKAISNLCWKMHMTCEWYNKFSYGSERRDSFQFNFFFPKQMTRIDDCAYASV